MKHIAIALALVFAVPLSGCVTPQNATTAETVQQRFCYKQHSRGCSPGCVNAFPSIPPTKQRAKER